MTPLPEKAILHLYAVFSAYEGNCHIQGSPLYGDLTEWNRQLFSKPLRDLTSEDLSRFAGKAITTWGDENDLRHFLPRMLELTAELNTPYDIGILYQKLEDAGWRNWPASEQEAINNFSPALWKDLLQDDSDKAEDIFSEYFRALAHSYPAFPDLLNAWDQEISYAAVKHLANYIFEENQFIFNPRRLAKDLRHNDVFRQWLVSEKTTDKLTTAFFRFEQSEISERISWAVKILEDQKGPV